MAKLRGSIYRRGLRRFVREAEKKKEGRRKGVLRRIKEIIPEFLNCFSSVKNVAVIGSVAKKEFYSSRSDTDILVKGLAKGDYFKAFSFWEDKLGTEIDLVREEEVAEEMRLVLSKNEVVFYEKN